MRIAVTTTFRDKTKPDADPVEAGTTLNVTAERGAELIEAGVGHDASEPAPAPPTA